MRKTWRGYLCLFSAVGFLSAAALVVSPAAADEMSDMRAELQEMRRQMQEQMKKMEELQQRIEGTEKKDQEKSAKIAELEATTRTVVSQEPGEAGAGYVFGEGVKLPGAGGITLNGYFDAHYEDRQSLKSTFDAHVVSLYVNAPLGERAKVFAELEWEHGAEFTGSGSTVTGDGDIKIERGWLEWAFADWAKFRIGKQFTPMSSWNLLHAYPLIPSHTHPLLMQRGRTPRFFSGIQLDGIFLPKIGEIDYYLGVGNGKGSRAYSTDGNQDKLMFAKFTYIPPLKEHDLGDLQVGFWTAAGKDGSVAGNPDETLGGAEVIYTLGPLKLWMEGYRSWVNSVTAAEFEADGFFIMGIYEFLTKYSGYVRYEENEQQSTAINTDFNNGRRWVYGLSYRPIPPVVCRVEYIDHRNEGEDINDNSVVLSVASMF